MNLTISGHHLEVTPALRGYVSDKLDRITRHFEQVMDVRVLLSVDNLKEKDRRQRAECNIKVKGGELHAESAHEDLYAAVDELVDKLDRQLVRDKDKRQTVERVAEKHLRKYSQKITSAIDSTFQPPLLYGRLSFRSPAFMEPPTSPGRCTSGRRQFSP